MEKFFRTVTRIYKDYRTLEDRLSEEYKQAMESGNYNKSYLNGMRAEHNKKLADERMAIANRMSDLREEFEGALAKRYDFEDCVLSDKLIKILNSGIKLDSRELLYMAEKHKGNILESRLLHDYAESNGYTLNNYVPFDDAVREFDNLIRHTRNSLSDDKLIAMYPTLEDCEFGAGQAFRNCTIPKMECYSTPKTIEESIARESIKDEVSEEQAKAFVEGFTGEPPKEITEADKLTTIEREKAEQLSYYNGNKGTITEQEIEEVKEMTATEE
ncbi:MAG: hypothetical protein ACI4GW_08240 [Lachnospiraceae bacterium]